MYLLTLTPLFNLICQPTYACRSISHSKLKDFESSFSFGCDHLLVLFLFAGLAKVKPAVKIVSPLKNQIIRYRNESLLFNCTVTPAGRVNGTNLQWLKNDDLYEPTDKIHTPYWSSFELRKGLQLGDEGVYKCTSVVGSDTVEVRLAGKSNILIFSKPNSSVCNKKLR